MRCPSLPPPSFLLALALAFAACQCETLPPSVACTSDANCSPGSQCRDGACTKVSTDAGLDAGEQDAGGSADAGCPHPCGQACCGDEEVCEEGACRLDCGAAARCGAAGSQLCCGEGEVCYREECVVPGPTCESLADCIPGEYCDPAIGRCLERGDGTCEYRPPAGAFSPADRWHFSVTTDSYTQVMMTPVVIDVNADGTPDVLANFFGPGGYNAAGVLRALSGDDGRLLWTSADSADQHVRPPASIAAGDLDGSGRILVVTVSFAGPLLAFDGASGALVWTSHDAAGEPVNCAASWGGPSLADLDGDGGAEVVCGLKVFDKDGLLRWDQGMGAGRIGPLSIAADLDGDWRLEVTDGASAFRHDGTPLGWTGPGFGGFPATGDFLDASNTLGRDGRPELVVVNSGALALVSGATGELLAGPAALPSWNGAECVQGGGNPGSGGPPTVADFDGDGQAEVGVAALDCYTVFEVALEAGAPVFQVLWSKKVQDHSSSVTGSSVFDFEGDGAAEVVYADEVLLHVFRGSDGEEIFSRPNCSGTTYEYPVIVDVDGNGRADIVIAQNTYAAVGLGCDPAVQPGIHVYSDAADNWVNTRRIWNQHAYHVTNVCDGIDRACGGRGAEANTYGRIPASEMPNWAFTNLPPGEQALPLNNFRQNVQGEGLFSAPDLVGQELSADRSGCPAELTLSARVTNDGALGVLPGLKVAFYREGSPRELLAVGETRTRLLPGESEVVSAVWQQPAGSAPRFLVVAVVDDDGSDAGAVSECRETNNELGPFETGCGAGPS